MTITGSNAMFFNNGNVREKFAMDEHYVGCARNRPVPLFRVFVNCHEGYMVYACDEEHPKQIYLMKALSSSNFVQTNPNFR